MSCGEKLPSASPAPATVREAARATQNNRSCSEALAAGTMRHRVRVRDLEPALLQIVTEIKERSAHEKRAFRIDDDAHVRRFHHDVAIRGPIDQIHLVLQPGA